MLRHCLLVLHCPPPRKTKILSLTLVLTLDQAQMIKLPEAAATMVVGNPLIADISIQSGGMAVLTGKGYGVTNIVALDRFGAMLEQKTIEVQGARDSVVVYRGVEVSLTTAYRNASGVLPWATATRISGQRLRRPAPGRGRPKAAANPPPNPPSNPTSVHLVSAS